MSDLFHEGVSDDYIAQVCDVMLAANWHTDQILTKRVDRMRHLPKKRLRSAARASHIWWGVSVENKRHGLPRIDRLRQANCSVPFLSIEPLLEDLGEFDLSVIQWVIVGGESGHGARPLDAQWFRSIRSQCRAAEIPFFFKQWGGVRKSDTGRLLDGRTYDEFPKVPQSPVADSNDRKNLLKHLQLNLGGNNRIRNPRTPFGRLNLEVNQFKFGLFQQTANQSLHSIQRQRPQHGQK